MKIKTMTIWLGKSGLISIGVYYAVMAALYAVFTVTFLIGNDGVTVNGLGVSLIVMLLILGVISFGQNLRFGLANGVSRRSVFLSFVLFLVPTALGTAVINELLLLMLSMATHNMEDMLYVLYGEYIKVSGIFLGHVGIILASAALSMLFGMLGFLLGGGFYRLGKAGRYVMSIGLPVGLFGLLPLLIVCLPRHMVHYVGRAAERAVMFLASSPLWLALTAFLGAALIGLFCWLLIRKAPLKTA